MERVMFSSKDQTWETPKELFNQLDCLFGFELDVCADEQSKKCLNYYSEEQDGLSQPWVGRCWLNPPYNRKQHKWIEKGLNEIEKGNCNLLVVLIPARVETVAWQKFIFPNAKGILFFKGRLSFEGSSNSAPFPSALVVFGRDLTSKEIKFLQNFGTVVSSI